MARIGGNAGAVLGMTEFAPPCRWRDGLVSVTGVQVSRYWIDATSGGVILLAPVSASDPSY